LKRLPVMPGFMPGIPIVDALCSRSLR
jgi:hypothetical protein